MRDLVNVGMADLERKFLTPENVQRGRDEEFAHYLNICLWQRGMEGCTRRGQTLIVRPKRHKRKRK